MSGCACVCWGRWVFFGTAEACGDDGAGQRNLPALDGGLTYGLPAVGLQSTFDGASLHFATLGGEELCHIRATGTERLADLQVQLMHEIGSTYSRIDVVLPGGKLLNRILSEEPSALLGMLTSDYPSQKVRRIH